MKQKKGLDLGKLSSDFKNLFLPAIRHRGNNYVKAARVKLEKISDDLVTAKVQGNATYKVTINLEAKEIGTIKIGCTCPFFKQGIPCKHIWATIVAVERHFCQKGKSKSKALGIKPIDLNELIYDHPSQELDRKLPWKPLQDFVLRYELIIDDFDIKISAFEQYIKKDGSLGRIKKLSSKLLAHPNLPEEDRLILPFITQIMEDLDFQFDFLFSELTRKPFMDIPLNMKDLATLLPILAKTKRCKVIGKDSKVIANPIMPSNDASTNFELVVSNTNKDKLTFIPQITIGDNKVDPKEVCLIDSSPVLFIYQSRLYSLSWPSFQTINKICQKGIKPIREKELPHLIKNIASTSLMAHLKLPENLLPNKTAPKDIIPNMILTIKPEGVIEADLFFLYEGIKIHASDKKDEIFDEANWQIIIREKDLEKGFIKKLKKLGFKEIETGLFEIKLDKAADALDHLEKSGAILEARDGKAVKSGTVKGFNISSGINWFDLDAKISFGEEDIDLPRIIKAYLKGQKTIKLASGDHGILPIKWIEKHKRLFELAKVEKNSQGRRSLRFPSTHALIIDSLLDEAQEITIDDGFKSIKEKLNNFKGIKPKEPVKTFVGKLRHYQKDALGWFEFLRQMNLGGILADDMGLGKTVQILALLEEMRNNQVKAPHLIIAPTSVVFNWIAEAERFTPELKFVTYLGQERKTALKNLKNAQVLLSTYGILRRDIEILKDIEFYYCILDESQYIKNPDSQTAKASRLINAKHKLCLTGTPIENHLGELWSQMQFLNPGLLGSKDKYLERFAKPASLGDKEVLNTLKKIVAPVILRRTKEEVAKELPDKIESIIRCTMTSEQMKLYEKLKDHYRASILQTIEKKGISRSKMMVLEGLLRLRQVANHPALIGEPEAGSGKFTQLLNLLEESLEAGHKVLIFSQFTKMLQLIKKELEARNVLFEYLDGKTPQSKREEKVKNFQEDNNIRAFLISLRAGGFGLNLTSADYVFIVDPWWNPAVELQAIDRTHRIGQTKKVVTYRLISKDSVEEKVLKLQKKKQEIVGSILSGSKDLLKNLTQKDLEILFS